MCSSTSGRITIRTKSTRTGNAPWNWGGNFTVIPSEHSTRAALRHERSVSWNRAIFRNGACKRPRGGGRRALWSLWAARRGSRGSGLGPHSGRGHQAKKWRRLGAARFIDAGRRGAHSRNGHRTARSWRESSTLRPPWRNTVTSMLRAVAFQRIARRSLTVLAPTSGPARLAALAMI
jgi:hypothetical protein